MTKIIAVVGLGSIALRHRRNLKMLFPQFKIVAIPSRFGRSPDKVEYADIVLADIDSLLVLKPYFVIIASPSSYHLKHAKPLLEQAIPLLIEKPVTAEDKDANELLYLAQKYNTAVAVGYCLRYLPSAKMMKKLLNAHKVGSIYNVFINIGQFLPDWRPNTDYQRSVSALKKLGGGALLELSHELDYARWLLGEMDIEQVILRGSRELDIDVEAFADISLTNNCATLVHIHLDFLQKQCQRNCSIIGSKGRLDWDLLTNSIIFHHGQGSEILYSEPSWDKNEMYLAMIQDFIKFIGGNDSDIVTLQGAVDTLLFINNIKSKAQWRAAV